MSTGALRRRILSSQNASRVRRGGRDTADQSKRPRIRSHCASVFAVEPAVPKALAHAHEDVVGLRARHKHPLIDRPGWNAGAELDRGPCLRLDPLHVPAVP
jgi:hypothetical protein